MSTAYYWRGYHDGQRQAERQAKAGRARSEEPMRLAVHEAAHSVVGHVLGIPALRRSRSTPRQTRKGAEASASSPRAMTRREPRDRAVASLARAAAAERLLGLDRRGVSLDDIKARRTLAAAKGVTLDHWATEAIAVAADLDAAERPRRRAGRGQLG